MARHSVRLTLRGESNRLRRIEDELTQAAGHLAPLDILTASHLDWALIHIRGASRELEQLMRIADYEASKRGGK